MDAALAEFTERGFEAARMEDIAKRAGISKAAIYLYFTSKTALLEALIQAHVAPFARQTEQLAMAGSHEPLAALRAIAAAAALKLADARAFAVPRLIMTISGRFPEIADYYRRETADRARAALEGLFETAMRNGAIRRVNVKAASRAFIGPLFFEAMWMHVLRGESAFAQPDQLIADHFDILLNGLERRA